MNNDEKTPQPDPAIHSFQLEDGYLLFSEVRQEIHALNPTAAVIWCLLLDGENSRVMADTLRELCGVSPSDAADFVSTALADWRRRGFLAGHAPDHFPVVQPPQDDSEPPLRKTPRFVVEHVYAVLRSRLKIRFTTAEQAAVVHPILAHLHDGAADYDVVLDVVQTGGRVVLYRDGAACGSCGALNELAPLLKGVIWTTAVNRGEFFLGIHAGVVDGPAGAMLLPGDPGSGKSTLTASLVHAGFGYFSDEMAPLRDGDLHVLPTPFSLCIKHTGLDILASRIPALRKLPLHERADGKRVVYLPPPRDSLPPSDGARPVRSIVFPRYAAGAPMLCRTIPKTEALQRLMGQCVVVRGKLDRARVQALVHWIAEIGCYDLAFGDLADGEAAAIGILTG